MRNFPYLRSIFISGVATFFAVGSVFAQNGAPLFRARITPQIQKFLPADDGNCVEEPPPPMAPEAEKRIEKISELTFDANGLACFREVVDSSNVKATLHGCDPKGWPTTPEDSKEKEKRALFITKTFNEAAECLGVNHLRPYAFKLIFKNKNVEAYGKSYRGKYVNNTSGMFTDLAVKDIGHFLSVNFEQKIIKDRSLEILDAHIGKPTHRSATCRSFNDLISKMRDFGQEALDGTPSTTEGKELVPGVRTDPCSSQPVERNTEQVLKSQIFLGMASVAIASARLDPSFEVFSPPTDAEKFELLHHLPRTDVAHLNALVMTALSATKKTGDWWKVLHKRIPEVPKEESIEKEVACFQ